MLRIALFLITLLLPAASNAQDGGPLTFATVDRPPFAEETARGHEGFSIDLMRAIAADLGREVRFETYAPFGAMLEAVQEGEVDGAVANISITAIREEVMDFSQPMFAAGIKVMIPEENEGFALFRSLMTKEILYAVLAAIGLLYGGGLLMWVFERRKQPYFDRPMKDALFPSFWWALNLVVNGGFEERMPQSRPGRVFAVVLVVASLFIVSVFVAQITAATTVNALQRDVSSINDLDGKRVGTVDGSTSANLLDNRDIRYTGFDSPTTMLAEFENGTLDAVVFDAPILSYYAAHSSGRPAMVLDRNYRPESYGIALPSGSPLREDINKSLLRLRETGVYDALIAEWFGGR